jgi:hypothetical protein
MSATPAPRTPATAQPTPAATQASGGGRGPSSRDRLLTTLAGRPSGASVAELARITGLGHSTAGKALVAAETDGLVTRHPGGRDGARRNPDTWALPPTPATPGKTDTPEGPALPAPAPAATGATPDPPSTPEGDRTDRLGKGQLADLVMVWLHQHPDPGGHTAAAIGKAITRSSGAIANALARLAATQTVTQVSDHPRKYAATRP